MRGRVGALGLGLANTFACLISEVPPPPAEEPVLKCETDADCRVGSCNGERGFCQVSSSQLGALLLRVTPAPLDPSYQGREYFTVLPAFDENTDGLTVQIPARVTIQGSVRAEASCLGALPEQDTLPVELTFTPREQLLGLSVRSYRLRTAVGENGEHRFQGLLPPGRYDVYIRPELSMLDADCTALPQLFRNQRVEAGSALDFEQPVTGTLRLSTPWVPAAQGWVADMVHPATGELISNSVVFDERDVENGVLTATLRYSTTADDYVGPASELVRLRPPPSVLAGTVLLQRAGLELTAGQGELPNVFEDWDPVTFSAWVWRVGELDTPVSAMVELAATQLTQAPTGVVTQFEVTTQVDDQGQLRLSLLPGEYRVRVRPPGAELELGHLAGYEVQVEVLSSVFGGDPAQEGQRILVPPAPSVSGRVQTLAGALPVPSAEVWASDSQYGPPFCTGAADEDNQQCSRPRPKVLRRALAQDQFVARNVSALVDGRGVFTLEGLDCQLCSERAGAPYDLSVRPDPRTGLPWYVEPAANLERSNNRVLNVRTPFVQELTLQYENGSPVRNARIQLYGRIKSDLGNARELDLPACSTVVGFSGEPCIQSVLQVGEATTDDRGQVTLLLPPALN